MPEGVSVHADGRCESATVGPGTRVWAFAHVMPGAAVGRDVCVGAYSDGGAVVGDRRTVMNLLLTSKGETR